MVGIRQIRDCRFSRTHRYHGRGSLASSQSLRRGFKVYTFVRMASDTVKQRGKALRTDQSAGFNSLVKLPFCASQFGLVNRGPRHLLSHRFNFSVQRIITNRFHHQSKFSSLFPVDFTASEHHPFGFSRAEPVHPDRRSGAPQIRAGTEPILELCPMAVNSKPNTPYSLKRLICGYEPSKPVICASPRARDNRICF